MPKEIFYGKDAFNKLLEGSKKLNDAVVVTMGARGRNVLIEDTYGSNPQITKDGITVAKAVQLKDSVEKIACNLIRNVSLRTNDVVGDGSTTAICLANAILQHGAKEVEAGADPISIKRGIDMEMRETIEYLDSIKTSLNDDMDKAREVALVSANGDSDIADKVVEVYKMVGKDGNVAIETDPNSPEITFDKVEGVEFDRGFNNPYYITDIATETVEYSDAVIVVSDYKINSIYEIKNVLELAQKINKPLVLICEEIDPEADNYIALNKIKNGLRVVTVNAPEFGDRRLNFLEDLAIVTGGSFVSTVTGTTFDDVTEEHLGKADKVLITRDNTSIIGGKGDSDRITERVEGIRSQIQNAKGEHKTYLEKRYAKVKGGFAVIKVGGLSEVERFEIKDRVEDAVNAVKSALKDGIIPGGGSALLRISYTDLVYISNAKYEETPDILKGRMVLKKALAEPFKQILTNAGIKDVNKWVDEFFTYPDLNTVFNVDTYDFEDGIRTGIIDPVLVTKTALKNAASVAGTILTTGCTISFEPDIDQNLKL